MRGHFGDEPPTDTCENCGYGCNPDHRGLCAECAAAEVHTESALDADADAIFVGSATEAPDHAELNALADRSALTEADVDAFERSLVKQLHDFANTREARALGWL